MRNKKGKQLTYKRHICSDDQMRNLCTLMPLCKKMHSIESCIIGSQYISEHLGRIHICFYFGEAFGFLGLLLLFKVKFFWLFIPQF